MRSIISKIFQILVGYSPYFDRLFYGPFKEATTGRYVITEPKAEALVTLISIAASCDFKMINKNNGIYYIFRTKNRYTIFGLNPI